MKPHAQPARALKKKVPVRKRTDIATLELDIIDARALAQHLAGGHAQAEPRLARVLRSLLEVLR